MRTRDLHAWDVDSRRAREIQEELRERVRFEELRSEPRLIAGADISYNKYDDRLYAAVVVMRTPDMVVVEKLSVMLRATFPYVPGYLSFREVPPLVEAFKRLKTTPDALICDGQGLAHPRFFGLACHLGLILDIPTLGCGKTRLVGEYREPAARRWSATRLMYKERQVGLVVRTRDSVAPLYLSPGHKIDMDGALKVLKLAVGRYRQPEPIRAAHNLANEARRAAADQ